MPNTSFIPKQSAGTMPGRAPRRATHFNLFNFIGMVIFLCGLIMAVGVFLYKDLSVKDLAVKKSELQEKKSSFSLADIDSLRELDRRINVSRALLDAHLSPSAVFDTLERHTLRDASYTVFSYLRRESGSVEIVLDGVAPRFNTVALLSQEFQRAPEFADVIFSDLQVDAKSNQVSFTVTSQAEEGALRYSAPQLDIPAVTASSTATTSASVAATSTDTVLEQPVENVASSTTPNPQ